MRVQIRFRDEFDEFKNDGIVAYVAVLVEFDEDEKNLELDHPTWMKSFDCLRSSGSSPYNF